MGRPDVFEEDLFLLQRVPERDSANGNSVEPGFHALANDRFSRAAIMSFQFESVKNGRIVARCDHDAADGALGLDGEGDRGSGRRLRGEGDLKTVPGQDFRRSSGKLVGEKAPVEADNRFLLGARDRVEVPVIRRGLGHAVDVRERKILGDHRPPAVRSEPDLSHDSFTSCGLPARPQSSASCAAPP